MYTPTVVEDDSGSEQMSGSEIMGQQHVALISHDGTQQVSDDLLCLLRTRPVLRHVAPQQLKAVHNGHD